MNHEEFGTTGDYLRAFEAVLAEGVPENHRALLRAHFAAPDHSATWAGIATAVGYSNGKAVNLQYGKLARRVAQHLGVVRPPHDFWLYILVGWATERDSQSGHTAFVLRRPVIDALTQLGVLAAPATELPANVLDITAPLREGAMYQVLVSTYERDPEARRRCIASHGTTCSICGFSFAAVYGPEADGYIHVHHVRPLSEIGGEYVVDPVEDLRPVCPNCHAVLHLGGRCRSIEDVRRLLAQQKHA